MTTFTPLVLLCACGGGGGGGGDDDGGGGQDDFGLAELSACTADAFGAVAYLIDDFDALIDEINGINRSEVSVYDTSSGAFVLDADLDDDGFDETTVNGQVVAVTGDFTDGLDLDEEIAANWDLLSGPVGGNGQFGYKQLAGNQRNLTGRGFVTLVNGCTWQFSNINLALSPTAAPTGTFDFTVTIDTNTLAGTVTINPSGIADVDATLNGVGVQFQIDTDDFSLIP